MENSFSMKELYDVFLKTTYPIEIAGKQFDADETLCVFDKIQISNFEEVKNRATAHGGFGDRDRVFWESTKEINLAFSQGIFNTLQFGLLVNAKIIYNKENEALAVSKREEVESNEEKIITFSEIPYGKFFIYDKLSSDKIIEYTVIDEKNISIEEQYKEVILDYKYAYAGNIKVVTIGKQLIPGFLRLEGKTRVKDDISGKVRTGIIEIPKLKLMSDLSMRLGKNANPVAANFYTKALPKDEGKDATVMNLFFLDDDIDSDM